MTIICLGTVKHDSDCEYFYTMVFFPICAIGFSLQTSLPKVLIDPRSLESLELYYPLISKSIVSKLVSYKPSTTIVQMKLNSSENSRKNGLAQFSNFYMIITQIFDMKYVQLWAIRDLFSE